MFEERVVVPGFSERTAVFSADPERGAPCIGNDPYLCATCFGLSWFYRLWFHCFSTKLYFNVRKKYFVSSGQVNKALVEGAAAAHASGSTSGSGWLGLHQGQGHDNHGYDAAGPSAIAVL